MKRAIGIDFTDLAVRTLHARGFSVEEEAENHGFRSFYFPLLDRVGDPQAKYDGFEIHVITDEVDYLSHQGLRHFYPFIQDGQKPQKDASHENTVIALRSLVMAAELPGSDLRTYLELRKNFALSALELQCRDFEKFVAMARPDRLFESESGRKALIHLGPSCFDLLISAE